MKKIGIILAALGIIGILLTGTATAYTLTMRTEVTCEGTMMHNTHFEDLHREGRTTYTESALGSGGNTCLIRNVLIVDRTIDTTTSTEYNNSNETKGTKLDHREEIKIEKVRVYNKGVLSEGYVGTITKGGTMPTQLSQELYSKGRGCTTAGVEISPNTIRFKEETIVKGRHEIYKYVEYRP